MSRSKWIVLIGVVVFAVAAYAVAGPKTAQGGLVDNARLRELAADGVRLVDVRTVAEFEGGHILGAENVPVSELAAAAKQWDPSEPIALYCATGNRSADAASTLRSLGFETVYDLGGGIAQWDGDIEAGAQQDASARSSASGLPVMYEFYTDW